jgi:hypothetical protein
MTIESVAQPNDDPGIDPQGSIHVARGTQLFRIHKKRERVKSSMRHPVMEKCRYHSADKAGIVFMDLRNSELA